MLLSYKTVVVYNSNLVGMYVVRWHIVSEVREDLMR